jgi:NAD(P)-dependent dehydrogenase (short-subunit alcohol dehydrogenase family)
MTTRRYLVTGGTSGIGAAVVGRLVDEGHQVWATSSSPATVQAFAGEVPGAHALVADTTDPHAMRDVVASVVAEVGGLDGVFLSAGIDGQGAPAQDVDPVTFRRVLDVNVVGTLIAVQAALPHLARPGVIVINASVNAIRPEAHFVDYNASKAAALSVAKTLALEYSGDGISVVGLCPGYFPTRMTQEYLTDPVISQELLAKIPAGRFGTLAEIAALVDFLLSGQASFLTGATITIDGAGHV